MISTYNDLLKFCLERAMEAEERATECLTVSNDAVTNIRRAQKIIQAAIAESAKPEVDLYPPAQKALLDAFCDVVSDAGRSMNQAAFGYVRAGLPCADMFGAVLLIKTLERL